MNFQQLGRKSLQIASCGIAFTLVFPANCWAQSRIDPKNLSLSPTMQKIFSKGANFAGVLLWGHFEKYARQGSDVIGFSDMDAVLERNLAESRASKVYGYLSVDLNWDGKVTRSELETVFKGEDQGFVDGYLLDGDLNSDGVITLAEMVKDANDEHQVGTLSNGYRNEMLAWDLNRDERLEWSEVMAVINAYQNN